MRETLEYAFVYVDDALDSLNSLIERIEKDQKIFHKHLPLKLTEEDKTTQDEEEWREEGEAVIPLGITEDWLDRAKRIRYKVQVAKRAIEGAF